MKQQLWAAGKRSPSKTHLKGTLKDQGHAVLEAWGWVSPRRKGRRGRGTAKGKAEQWGHTQVGGRTTSASSHGQ